MTLTSLVLRLHAIGHLHVLEGLHRVLRVRVGQQLLVRCIRSLHRLERLLQRVWLLGGLHLQQVLLFLFAHLVLVRISQVLQIPLRLLDPVRQVLVHDPTQTSFTLLGLGVRSLLAGAALSEVAGGLVVLLEDACLLHLLDESGLLLLLLLLFDALEVGTVSLSTRINHHRLLLGLLLLLFLGLLLLLLDHLLGRRLLSGWLG